MAAVRWLNARRGELAEEEEAAEVAAEAVVEGTAEEAAAVVEAAAAGASPTAIARSLWMLNVAQGPA